MPPFSLDNEPASLMYLINLTAGLMDGDAHLSRSPAVGIASRRHWPIGDTSPPSRASTRPSNGTSSSKTRPVSSCCPGPTIPFRDCRYFQRGRVQLAPRARLIWGDIWLAGRYDRGALSERFQFERIVQDFEVRREAGSFIAIDSDGTGRGRRRGRVVFRRHVGLGQPLRRRADARAPRASGHLQIRPWRSRRPCRPGHSVTAVTP